MLNAMNGAVVEGMKGKGLVRHLKEFGTVIDKDEYSTAYDCGKIVYDNKCGHITVIDKSELVGLDYSYYKDHTGAPEYDPEDQYIGLRRAGSCDELIMTIKYDELAEMDWNIVACLVGEDRIEDNLERKHRSSRWCTSTDSVEGSIEVEIVSMREESVEGIAALEIIISEAMSALSETQRDEFILKTQGYTNKEIGEIRGVSGQSAGKNIKKATERLKEILAESMS